VLSAVLVLLVASGLGVSAWLLASCLRPTAAAPFLLMLYLLAWAELVLAALLLSAFGALGRSGLVATTAGWVLVAGLTWRASGRPRPPDVRARLRSLATELRRPPLAILAAAVAGSYAYLLALGLVTPQNDGDPLVYQLARAALWLQEGSVSIVGSTIEPRLDGNPIVAELGLATWLALGDGERWVLIGQLSAVGALSVGSFALARRVGLPPHGALLSALLVPTLPVVATQAIAAYNDLVLASFVVAACVFAIGRGRGELVALAVASALATATKFTAPFVFPIVVALALVGRPLRRGAASLAAVALGTAAGAGWQIANLIRTGDLDGGVSELVQRTPIRSLSAVSFSFQRLTLDAIELPGGGARGYLAYIVVGVLLAAVGFALTARGAGGGASLVAAGVAVALVPAVAFGLHGAVSSASALLWEQRGIPDRVSTLRDTPFDVTADGAASWYGPVALALVLVVGAVAIVRVRRGALRPSGLVLAIAPLAAVFAIAVGLNYDPWRGRFVAAAVVAASALWGIALERRWAGLAVSAAASLTLVLVVARYEGKPSGLPGLSSATGAVWSRERWDAQTVLRRFTPRERRERAAIRFVQEVVPDDAELAVSLWGNDFLFPYFGARLDRPVTVIDPKAQVPDEAEWLVAAPESRPRGCAADWRLRFGNPTGWRVLERTGETSCTTPRRLE
jgi:hypothetical protein